MNRDRNNYYIAWCGRTLLVSWKRMRTASAEEAATSKLIAEDATLAGKRVREKPTYVDARAAPPEVPHYLPRSARLALIDEEAVHHSKVRRVADDERMTDAQPAGRPALQDQEEVGAVTAEDEQMSQSDSDHEHFWKEVEDEHEEYHRQRDGEEAPLVAGGSLTYAEKRALEEGQSVPEVQRSKLPRFEMPPALTEGEKPEIVNLVMLSCVDSTGEDQWYARKEARGLRKVLHLPGITAVRVHKQPRKKLYPHPQGKNLSRLTFMMTQEHPNQVFFQKESEEEAKIGTSKRLPLWRGVTVFYTGYEDAVRRLERKEAAPLQRPFMPVSRLFENEASRIFATASCAGRDLSGTQKPDYRTDLYLQFGRDVCELTRFLEIDEIKIYKKLSDIGWI